MLINFICRWKLVEHEIVLHQKAVQLPWLRLQSRHLCDLNRKPREIDRIGKKSFRLSLSEPVHVPLFPLPLKSLFQPTPAHDSTLSSTPPLPPPTSRNNSGFRPRSRPLQTMNSVRRVTTHRNSLPGVVIPFFKGNHRGNHLDTDDEEDQSSTNPSSP